MSDLIKAAHFASIYFIGNVLRRVVAFIMLPIYTHHLAPSDYGIVGILTIFFFVVVRLLGGRLGGIARFYYDSEAADQRRLVVSTALVFTMAVSIVPTVLTMAASEDVSRLLLGDAQYATVVALFAITVFTGAIEEYGFVYIRLRERPYLFVTLGVLKLAMQLALNIWFIVYEDMGVMGVALSTAISSVVMGVGMFTYLAIQVGVRFGRVVGLRLFTYSWPLWFSGLAAIYIWAAGSFYLRILDSLDSVGIFELAVKFGTLFIVLCWEPFNSYWMTEKFNLYYRGGREHIFRVVYLGVSGIVTAGAILISAFAVPLVHVLSAEPYHSAAAIIPIIALGSIFSVLAEYVNIGLLVADKTKIETRNNVIAAIVSTVLALLLVPRIGVAGAAFALLAARFTQFITAFYSGRVFFDPGFRLSHLAILIGISLTTISATNILPHTTLLQHFLVAAAVSGLGVLAVGTLVATQKEVVPYRADIAEFLMRHLRRRLPG